MGVRSSTIEMLLVDRVTGPAGAVTSSLRGLLGMPSFGAGGTAGMLGATVAGLAGMAAAYKAAQFAKEGFLKAAEERTEFMRIRQRTGATAEEIKKANVAIDEMTVKFGLAHENMMEGFKTLAVGGRSFADSLALLPIAATAAQAFGVEVKTTAAVVGAMSDQMKIPASEIMNAFDMIKGAGAAGKASAEELMTVLPGLGATARLAGMTGTKGFSQLLAVLETIRPNFASTEEAAGALENALKKMISKPIEDKFAKLGINLKDRFEAARKSGASLFEVFYNAALQATKGDLSRLGEVLGRQAGEIAKVLIALRDSHGAWQAQAEIMKHTGETAADAAEAMKLPEAELQRLEERWRQAKVTLGEALIEAGVMEGLKTAANLVKEAVQTLENMGKAPEEDVKTLQRWGVIELPEDEAEKVKILNERLESLYKRREQINRMMPGGMKPDTAALAQIDKGIADTKELLAEIEVAKKLREAAPGFQAKPSYGREMIGPPAPEAPRLATPSIEESALPGAMAPIIGAAESAGTTAGQAAGDSIISNMLSAVKSRIPEVARAITSGLSGLSVNVPVNVTAGGAAMRDTGNTATGGNSQ